MPSSNADPRRRLVRIACALASVAAIWLLVRAFQPPPQIGTDAEVFVTVDALFTALTSRDDDRLDACDERLHALRETNRLPAAAANYLDAVIDQARNGQWESAARKLYDFMYRQRRESANS
ncbi:MAG TPA: hypothetical protein VGM05_10975 [Planctomycetaceae bacterium]|jgi:hypothetical protein